MTPAQGAALFFDSLAEGLLLGLEDLHPVHIALKLDPNRIGRDDAEALSRAVFERFQGGPGVERKIEDLNQWDGSSSCIIDCDGKSFTEVIGPIRSLASDTVVVVIHNFGGDVNGVASVEYNPDSSWNPAD